MADIPADLAATLDPSLPVALLPIRLETRFGTRQHVGDDGSTVDVPVLRIRVYPDDISVVASPPGLSAPERDAGLEFWATHDAPPNDTEAADPGALSHRRTAAWELLVRHVGRERAAFVARSTRPDADGNPPAAPPAADDTAATARLLPDSWVVVGWAGGSRVLSTYVPGVPERVQVGPSRAAGADSFDPHDPHLVPETDALRWTTDFDAAERIAMAVTVDLATPEQAAAGGQTPLQRDGLDTLVVFGVREPNATRTPATEADAFVDLLSAHAATDRVAFLAQGTPTNNVAGRASGWTSAPDIFAAYARVVGLPDGAAGAAATGIDALCGGADNATTAATALGLSSDALAGLDGASALEQWPARAMTRALFPVTVGEVLGTLSLPPTASVEEHEHLLDRLDALIPFASEHMASFVRSRGPLPTLRVGRQPYGLLPVLPAAWWGPREGEDELSNLVTVLSVLRPFWEQAAGGIGRLGGTSLDLTYATERLVRVLGLGPVPHPGAYQVRDVTGPLGSKLYCPERSPFLMQEVTPDNVYTMDVVRTAVSDEVQLAGYRALLVMTLPGLVRGTTLEEMQLQGVKPLRVHVARSDPDRAGWASVPDYLHRLTESFDLQRLEVVLDPGEQHKPSDLLFVLAEHAMALSGELDSLLLLRRASANAASAVVRASPELLTSGLSVAANADAMLRSPFSEVQALAEPTGAYAAVSADLADKSAFEVIADDQLVERAREEWAIPVGHLQGFPGTRDAIDALADAALSDEEYTRLVGEALSCCTNRLDAWYTSLATQRLASLRAERPAGLQLGCWGLLVDVRPSTMETADVPAGWDPAVDDRRSGAAASRGPLRQPRRQIGYQHAPSLTHARTAGVLRAGELAYEDGSTLASLDLTSRRARIARDILGAVANGQPLGAVLGYRLERSLGDARLHDAVTTLRAAFPQRRSGADADTGAGAGVPASDHVVPPEVLDGLDVWRAGATATAMCTVPADRAQAFAAAFADLDTAAEAVADALVAEGVHHLASGRADAAGALFSATASGGHVDGDLDVLREPHAGTAITNRLVLLLDESGGVDRWDRTRPRAVLAPEVERWAETVLGPPSRWRAKVRGAASGLSLTDLGGLCALDVVVESASAGSGSRPPLEQRLAAATGVVTPDFAVESDGDGPAWAELLALAGAVRDVLATARPVVPADLDPGPRAQRPDAGVVRSPAGPTLTSLDPLAHRVADLLDSLAAGARAVASAPAEAPVAPLLEPFVALGLTGSLVAAPVLADAYAAAAAATATVTDADRVIDGTVAGLVSTGAVDQPAGTRLAKLRAVCRAPRAVDILVDLARRVAGSAVVPLPDVASALADHRLVDDARAPSSAAVEEWLGRVAACVPAQRTTTTSVCSSRPAVGSRTR